MATVIDLNKPTCSRPLAPTTANQVRIACTHAGGLRLCVFTGTDTKPKIRALAGPREGAPFGAYAVTRLDADYWKAWRDQNASSDLIRSRIVFALG
jgi:hypothetical protein